MKDRAPFIRPRREKASREADRAAYERQGHHLCRWRLHAIRARSSLDQPAANEPKAPSHSGHRPRIERERRARSTYQTCEGGPEISAQKNIGVNRCIDAAGENERAALACGCIGTVHFSTS